MKQTNTDGIKRAAEEVKPEIGLSPTKNAWQTFRRWLGIYTSEEKEVIAYSRRIKAETIAVAMRQKVVTSRPDWMRYEDYQKLRALQNKVERKKPRRK